MLGAWYSAKEKHRSNTAAGAYLYPQNLSQTVFDKMANFNKSNKTF